MKSTADLIPEMVLASIAPNTTKRYAQGLRTWNVWCSTHGEEAALPVDEFYLQLFIVSAIQSSSRFGKVDTTLCSLGWLHETLNMENPCKSKTIKALQETAKRRLSKPVRKKEPIAPHHLTSLAKSLTASTLLALRTYTVMLLSYAGFLRYDEVSRLRRDYIIFESTYMRIFIDHSKPDQHNVGEWVFIATGTKWTCPVKILRYYLRKAKPGQKEFIFRAMNRTKGGHTLRKGNKPIGYTTLREDVLRALAGIGLDRKNFGLHSMRRGGATYAANAGINDRLFKKHGRWKTDNAKDGYVAEDLNAVLSVSRNLGL